MVDLFRPYSAGKTDGVLSATPVRRDGHHPIVFMQCGPVRHSAPRNRNASTPLTVHPRILPAPDLPICITIQAVFRARIEDEARNRVIAEDGTEAYHKGRKILLPTERAGHVTTLYSLLRARLTNCFTLHGRLSRKHRTETMQKIDALSADEPRLIVATGKLIWACRAHLNIIETEAV